MGYGEDEAEKKAHVLLLCFPLQGHLAPMLYLARRLLALGFSITIANSEPSNQRLLQSWGSAVRLESYPDPFQGAPSHAKVVGLINSDQEFLQKWTLELLQRLTDADYLPFCVIFDPFMTWIVDLAHKFELYAVALWTSSALSLAFHLELPRLIQEGYIPAKNDDVAEEEIKMNGFPPMTVWDFPKGLAKGDLHDPMFNYRLRRIEQIQKADCILFNTFEELEKDSVSRFPNGISIGPVLSFSDKSKFGEIPAFWKEDKSCISWLDSKSPASVIYVSFGSVAMLSVEQIEEIAHGLKASGYTFLWVIRPNLLLGNGENFLEEFSSRNKKQGMVISWAPQVDVLRHPSVRGFLTHCGWNSTIECIYFGVPMLGWPCMAEQGLNCKFIADVWKIGLKMPKKGEDLVPKDVIMKMIQKLMQDEEVRKNANRIGIAARKAIAKDGSSTKNLEALAQNLRKTSDEFRKKST